VRVRATTDSPWLWLSKTGVERAIASGGPTALALYTGLAKLESDSPEKADFFASAYQLSRASGLGPRTVERTLPILQKAGLIAIQSGRHAGPGGAHQANKIRILSTLPPSATESEASVTESGFNGGHKITPLRGGKKEKAPRSAPGGSKTAPAGEVEEDYSWEPLTL
jgi:DNA-binding transcriptional ArsR family regulator